jgi:hypothetical protein
MLGVVNGVSPPRRLPAVIGGHRADGSFQPVPCGHEKAATAFADGVVDGLLVKLQMPEMMADKFQPKLGESEAYVIEPTAVDPVPINELRAARTTLSFAMLLAKSLGCLEAMQTNFTCRAGATNW